MQCFAFKLFGEEKLNSFRSPAHPQAKPAYAWSHREGQNDEADRFGAVLEIPPVISPQSAAKAAAASGAKYP